MKGKVKMFNNERGFGFITANGKDYFVHYTQIQSQGYKTLSEGQEVEFDAAKADRGVQAKNVRVI